MSVIRRWRHCWGTALVGVLLSAALARPEPPVGKTVAEVIPQGNKLQPSERITALMQTRPGQPFSQLTAQDDVAKLMQTGWFQDVRIATRPTDDDRVQVFVQVRELPNLVQEIVYRGAEHVSREELDKITGLRRGTPLSPIANQSARLAILRHYQEEGRFWTQVHLTEGGKPGDTRVVFDIIEGPKVKVSGIDFVGNHAASSGRLRTQLVSGRAVLGFIGGTYDPAQTELDVARLLDYYKTLGFHRVRVTPETIWSDDFSRVRLVYHIDEGPRHMIRRVQIEGNKVYTEDELKALTEARPGEYYDRNVIQADIERIRDYYGARGRLVPVAEKVYLNEDAPGEVFVHYEIHEREPARVGRIIIQGNTVTRDNVILRQVPLYPGQILSYPDLITAEQNLARLGIFAVDPAAGVRPTVTVLEPETDSPFKDILVQVQEQPTGSFMLGLGVNSNAGLSGSIVLNERNFDITRFPTSFEEILAGRAFRGAGQEFRLEAVPGTIFQRYSASFREPSVFDSPFSLATSIYYFTRGYAEYNENRYGGRLTVGRQITPIWSTFGTLRVEGINIHDVPIHAPFEIRRFVGDSFLLGLRAGVTRDTRDSFLRPTTGSLFEASFEQAFGDDTFPLGTVEATRYWTTYQRIDGSGKHVLALRTQASWAGPDTPIYEQFFAGGFGSIRGFEFRGVGPFENGFNTGGRFAFLNSLEYQIPILANDRVFFVSFLDSGAVESTTTIRDYRVTAGVGLRLAVPGMGPVPIALDFGFPIVKGPGDREQIFAFWLGFFN